MTTNDPDDFDPRFDPAFQRGFEPADPRFRSRPREKRVAGAEPAVVGSVQSSATPSSPLATPVPPLPAPTEPALPSIDHSAGTPDDAADAERATGVNPFVIALAVVSIVLVAGGVWGVQTAREPFLDTNAAANVDYTGLQMLMTFAPMAIALGLATAVGILFLFAVRWRRGR